MPAYNPMNAAQRRALRRTRDTQQSAASATSSPEPAVRKRLSLSRRDWLMLLLGAVIGAVISTLLALLTEDLARPWIAAKLRAPRVEISGYRLNPELSGMPCIQY